MDITCHMRAPPDRRGRYVVAFCAVDVHGMCASLVKGVRAWF